MKIISNQKSLFLIMCSIFYVFTANAFITNNNLQNDSLKNKRNMTMLDGINEQIKQITKKNDRTRNKDVKNNQNDNEQQEYNKLINKEEKIIVFTDENKENTITINPMKKVYDSTLSLMELYRSKLSNLQDGCLTQHSEEVCYSMSSHLNSQKDMKEITASINFGYGIADNISIGTIFSRTLHHIIKNSPVSIKKNHYLNSGIYAYLRTSLKDNKYWYIKPSAAFGGGYDIDIHRPLITSHNINEDGLGRSSISGFNVMFKSGQNITLSNDVNVDWHFGLGQINISRNNYKEKNKPNVSYEKYTNNSKIAYLGAKVNVPIVQKVQWISGIELEHEFKNKIPFITNKKYINQLVQDLKQKSSLSSIKGTAYSSVTYSLNENMKFSLTANLNRTNTQNMIWNGLINFVGNF